MSLFPIYQVETMTSPVSGLATALETVAEQYGFTWLIQFVILFNETIFYIILLVLTLLPYAFMTWVVVIMVREAEVSTRVKQAVDALEPGIRKQDIEIITLHNEVRRLRAQYEPVPVV